MRNAEKRNFIKNKRSFKMRILPIKEISKIREMLTVLEDKSDRDAMLFHLGVNCLLTITQLLKLKYKDVFDLYRHVKTEFVVKDRLIPITAEVRPRLIEYTERWEMDGDDWLFPSYRTPTKALTRAQAWRRLKKVAEELDIKYFSPRAMQKTFLYHIWIRTHDPKLMQKITRKNTVGDALHYIGVTEMELSRLYGNYGI